MHTIEAMLYGTPTCRRYQKMRKLLVDEAARLGIAIHIREVNETAQLERLNPLDLPRLYVDGHLIATRNPPHASRLAEILTQERDHGLSR